MTIHYKIKKLLKKTKVQNALLGLKKLVSVLRKVSKFVVGFTTLAASAATCLTVVQMRNERNQSYKPYFVMDAVHYKDEYNKPVFNIGDSRNLEDTLSVKIEQIPPMSIVIHNIGSGTAADIEIVFSDQMYENDWEIACEYYSDEEIQIHENQIQKYLEHADERIKVLHHINRKDLSTYRSYVVSGESIEIPLPEEYRRLFRAIAYCTKGDYRELPEIEFVIDYHDLQGIHYTEMYRAKINIEVHLNASDSINYAEYSIEPCKGG